MSEISLIAVPSHYPGGLEAERAGHFGRCDLFTLIEMHAGEIRSVRTVANIEHSHGGCQQPVLSLAAAGVNLLVVNGIGQRPRQGFARAGIEVLTGPGRTVGEVVTAFVSRKLWPIGEDNLCGSHDHAGGCAGDHH